MNVYVAGAFTERVACKKIMDALVSRGFKITHDWTKEDSEGLSGDVLETYLENCATADLLGVETCDAFILLASDEGRASHSELGMALALDKRVIVIRPRRTNNIFFHLPQVEFAESMATVLELLGS